MPMSILLSFFVSLFNPSILFFHGRYDFFFPFLNFSLKFWGLREVLRDKYKLAEGDANSLADFLTSLLEVSGSGYCRCHMTGGIRDCIIRKMQILQTLVL